jgi:hypothetical protein
VSDSFLNRLFSGNFKGMGEWQRRFECKRRLVEECEAVCVGAVQRAFGKRALLAATRECRPFRLPISGGHFDVWLIEEPHRLPGRVQRGAAHNVETSRVWLLCAGCRRRVSKLFYFYLAPGSAARSDLRCRKCHHLTYLCVNSGGNRWYREVARPVKRLLREKQDLLSKKASPRVLARLAEVESEIQSLRRSLKPLASSAMQSPRRPSSASQRRPYRNIELLGY